MYLDVHLGRVGTDPRARHEAPSSRLCTPLPRLASPSSPLLLLAPAKEEESEIFNDEHDHAYANAAIR